MSRMSFFSNIRIVVFPPRRVLHRKAFLRSKRDAWSWSGSKRVCFFVFFTRITGFFFLFSQSPNRWNERINADNDGPPSSGASRRRSGCSGQPGLLSLAAVSPPPQYSSPTQISQAFPVQPSQHSQVPQLQKPFPVRRGGGGEKRLELRAVPSQPDLLLKFTFSLRASPEARLEAD